MSNSVDHRCNATRQKERRKKEKPLLHFPCNHLEMVELHTNVDAHRHSSPVVGKFQFLLQLCSHCDNCIKYQIHPHPLQKETKNIKPGSMIEPNDTKA